MNKEKNFISAVVYTRNDEENIKNFMKELNDVLSDNFLKYEIIFVNDGSTDKTVDIIKEYAKELKDASVSMVNMSYYQGRELSMNAGIDLAIGDFIYQFETIDMDYDRKLVFDIYKKSLEGYDIVTASSLSKRRFTSKMFYKVFNRFSNTQYKLDTNTFEIISRRAINRINAINKTIPYRKAIEANCGLKVANVEYNPIAKTESRLDKHAKRERSKNAFDSLILFTDVCYKASVILSIIMILLVIAVAIYSIVMFVNKVAITGWTTTMLFLAFGFFGTFVISAFIIKYLQVLLNLEFKKTNYLVESIEKFK